MALEVSSASNATSVLCDPATNAPGFSAFVHWLSPYMDFLQLVAVFATLIVLIIYTAETRRSRQSSEKSLALLAKQFQNAISPRLSIYLCIPIVFNDLTRYKITVMNQAYGGTAFDVTAGVFTSTGIFLSHENNCEIVQATKADLTAELIPDLDTALSILTAAYGLNAVLRFKEFLPLRGSATGFILLCSKDSQGRSHSAFQTFSPSKTNAERLGKIIRNSFD